MIDRLTRPLRWLAAPLLLVALGACSGSDLPPADLVLTNGKVVTVDESVPEGQAVAITGRSITAVGTIEEIEGYIGDGTEVVDLEGRLVIPGFIEGHGHYMGLGRAQTILDLTTAESWQDIVDMVGEAAAEAEPGTWIEGRGWHQEKWTERPEPSVDGVPLHADLSAVSPENPVNLTHASGHASFVNARAMELAGIDASTPNPPGGEIVHDANGDPTGLLRETAQRWVGVVIDDGVDDPQARRAQAREYVRLAGEEALSKGVTSFQDAGSSFETIDFFRELESSGDLPIRLYVMVRGESNEEMAERLAEYRMPAEGTNDFLTVRSIKRQIDGALGAHGAWLLEPYADLPSSSGLNLEEPGSIRRTAEIAIENGYQVNTHAIGDRANREVLDIYEATFAEAGADGDTLRWRIEHAQHVNPDDIDRFAELGVIASMQGVHATSDGPWVLQRLGEERAESGAYLWSTFLDDGVVVTNGTDVPVEDISPIESYYATVSRRMSNGEVFYGDEAMTRMEALRSYTINGAYAAFEEDWKGSITPGKVADLVVLDRDILTVPESEIAEARVDLTIVGGEIRYRR